MKNKLKALVAGTLGVCAMAMVGVTKVEAASLTYGSVLVSTTSYAGDTKTWGFTTNLPSSNTTIAVGSDINGIVTSYGGDSSKTIQIKKDAKNAYDTYPGAEFLVPVPSATSTGTVTRTGNADATRYLALGSNEAKALTSSMSFDFTTTDIETNPTLSDSTTVTGYYLRFIVSGGEAKTYSLSVQLKDGTSSYGSASVTHTITYKDGDSTIYTDDAVEGSNITYSPKKYGYDFEGWYTEPELTNKVDSNYTVTADDTLYAKWTEWTTTGIEEYTLSNAAIGKIATGIDGSLTADLVLTPSIYTYMKGGAMTTTNVTLPNESTAAQNPCFNTNGAVSTAGNGIKFTAPFNGTLTTYIGCGGTGTEHARNAKLTDGTNDVIPTQGADALAFDGTTYAPIELTFEVTKGKTYYLGGTNGMRIYYLNFEADPSATFLAQYDKTTAADATKIRFVAVLDNITDVTTIDTVKFTLTYKGTEKTFACTQLYRAVTSLGTNGDYAAKTNRYFAVYTIEGNNIAAAIKNNETLSSLKLTITFTDGTEVVTQHADITLGSTLA